MMIKTFKTIFAILLVSNVLFAQETPQKQTLFSGKLHKIGIISSLSAQYTQFNNGFKPSMNGSISLLFNEKFGVGLAVYRIHDPNRTSGETKTNGMVGGLQLEYLTKPSKLVHLSFPLLIGRGVASSGLADMNFPYGRNGGRGSRDFDRRNSTRFLAIQPGVNVEVNLLKYLSMFGGVNYRIAFKNNNNSSMLSNNDLSGLGFQLGLRGGIWGIPLKKQPKTSN
jgi:hypothetical protein